MSAPHPTASVPATTDLPPPVTAADVWIGGLTDRETAESLIGDLVEERDEQPRGWYRRQLVGATARLFGRELRRTPFGIIGSMVLAGLAGFAASFLVTVAIVAVESVVAVNDGLIPRVGPIGLSEALGSVALALFTGPVIGVVAAATHRAAPLTPVLAMAVWTLLAPVMTQVISAFNPPPPGVVDSSPGLTSLAGTPIAVALVVVAGWWYARRRALRR